MFGRVNVRQRTALYLKTIFQTFHVTFLLALGCILAAYGLSTVIAPDQAPIIVFGVSLPLFFLSFLVLVRKTV